MTKLPFALLALTALAACTETVESNSRPLAMAPGKYVTSSSTTDTSGTTVTNKEYTNVTMDEYGRKRAVVESKTIEDPKGLFNKRTTASETEVIQEH